MSLLPLHRWSRRYMHVCTGVCVEWEEPVTRYLVKGLIYLCILSNPESSGRTAAIDKLHINAQTPARHMFRK